MEDQKLLVVVGATGTQGGGVVRAALADPSRRYRVRAVTRRASSPAARTLAEAGAEVVEADVADAASIQAAFTGAEAAFLVTSWGELMDPLLEIEHARTMAQAASAAGISHVVWSTFEDTRSLVSPDPERYPDVLGFTVPHIDGKASADQFFRDSGVPTTFLRTSFFWDNFTDSMPLSRDSQGELVLALAMADRQIAGIAGADVGPVAFGVLAAGARHINDVVSIAGEHMTGAQMAEVLADVLGEPVHYSATPIQTIRDAGFYLADDVANMFQFYIDHEDVLLAARDISATRAFHSQLQNFRGWAEMNRELLLERVQ